MKLRIVNNTGFGIDTKVYTEDGRDITKCISEIGISIGVGGINEARIRTVLANVDCTANPIFSEEDLVELAYSHGYELIKSRKG